MHQPANNPIQATSNRESTNLYARWHAIRLQEIQRQLSIMSDRSLYFSTQPIPKHAHSIYIPAEILELPIELVAAVAAFAWGESMALIHSHPHNDQSELFKFVHLFLNKYNYPIDRIVHFLLIHKEDFQKLSLYKQHLSLFLLAHLQGRAQLKSIQRRIKFKSMKRPCVFPLIG